MTAGGNFMPPGIWPPPDEGREVGRDGGRDGGREPPPLLRGGSDLRRWGASALSRLPGA